MADRDLLAGEKRKLHIDGIQTSGVVKPRWAIYWHVFIVRQKTNPNPVERKAKVERLDLKASLRESVGPGSAPAPRKVRGEGFRDFKDCLGIIIFGFPPFEKDNYKQNSRCI